VSIAENRAPLALVPIVAIPIFLAISNQTAISVALPAIGADLGALTRLPWLVIGYLLALTISAPVYGVLGDGYGRSTMLIGALWVYILGTAICVVAPNLEILAAGRLVQGFGGGGLMSLSQALIGQLVVARERGRAQGYVATISVVAATIGPVFGGLLVDSFGWRSLFLVTIPLALLAMGILIRQAIPKGDTERGTFDILGLVWLALLVVAWTVGLEFAKEPGQEIRAALSGIVGAASLFLLIRSQRKGANPLFPPRLLAITAIQRASVMVICHGAAFVSLLTMIPLFHNILRGDSTVEMSFALLALTVAFGTSGIVAGNLITLTGRLSIFPTLSLPAAVVAIALLGHIGADLGRGALLALYVVIGLSIGLVMSVSHTTIQNLAPDELRGRAAGSVAFFRSIGAVLGTAVVTLVLFALAPLAEGTGAGAAAILADPGALAPEAAEQWRRAFRAGFFTVAAFVFGAWIMAATTPARRII